MGLPANVALMLLLSECTEREEAERALTTAASRLAELGDAASAGRLSAAFDLLRANPQAFDVVRSVLSGLNHQNPASAADAAADGTSYWAAAFDNAARKHPEASVALYALGNADLLASATREITGKLAEWGLLSPEAECLDVGCGIGRLEQALAPFVARIVGLDISEAMVEAARDRCAGLANVEIHKTSGGDLSGWADRSFDLVLAVDSFPYIVQAGFDLTQRMFAECARVLRPGARLVILNYSYSGSLARNRADLQGLAEQAGLRIIRNGTSEFSLWDGVSFDLEKV